MRKHTQMNEMKNTSSDDERKQNAYSQHHQACSQLRQIAHEAPRSILILFYLQLKLGLWRGVYAIGL